MQALKEIHPLLKGRGWPNCMSVKCDCGENFLWPAADPRDIRCPTCRAVGTITEDAATFNGQVR